VKRHTASWCDGISANQFIDTQAADKVRRQEFQMGKQAIGASIRSSRGNECSAVIGAPQRLACEWSRGTDNHTGRIRAFAAGLD
jgi:hypothetical protein